MKRNRLLVATALAACLGLVAAACGDDDDEAAETPAETDAAADEAPAETEAAEEEAPAETDAAADEAPAETEAAEEEMAEAVCPPNIVVQKDWWPELEHGGTYQLIGTDGEVDAANFNYSGPIADAYKVGGVETVEIRAGGDAVSFTPVTSLMATDDDITFGYVAFSDIVADSVAAPVVAVGKTLDVDPQMVMWDPEQLDISAPADIAASGAEVLHFDGAAYIDYMIGEGLMEEGQSNPSYGGAPDTWVAQGGNFIQQGFATNEVYKYESEIEWKDGAPAPVEFFTVADLGFDNYPALMSVRADRLDELSPCLEVLVPAMAQAWVDYLADPTPITDKITEINVDYNTYWSTSPELNARGIEIIETEGIAVNSPDGTYCSMDPDRAQEVYDILAPIYDERGIDIAEDVAATFDNSFCEGAPGR